MKRMVIATLVSILLIVAIQIINIHHIDLQDKQGRAQFIKEYVQWFAYLGKNFKSTAGYVVQQRWAINQTNNQTIT